MKYSNISYAVFGLLLILASFCKSRILLAIVASAVFTLDFVITIVLCKKDFYSNKMLHYLIEKKHVYDICTLSAISVCVLSFECFMPNGGECEYDLRLRLCCTYLISMLMSYIEITIMNQNRKGGNRKTFSYVLNLILGSGIGLIIGCLLIK